MCRERVHVPSSNKALCSLHVGTGQWYVSVTDARCFYVFSLTPSVSEAPKEAPVRKYLPSSVYLEEKTDEQKKEEVRTSRIGEHFSFLPFRCLTLEFASSSC